MNTLSENKKIIKFFKPLDILVIFSIVFVSVAIVVSMFNKETSDDLIAVIKYDGNIVSEYKLSSIDKPQLETIEKDLKLTIKLERDGVTVIESQCHNKICVNTGKIDKAGEVVVCLPAKVTVELMNKEELYNGLDAVVG